MLCLQEETDVPIDLDDYIALDELEEAQSDNGNSGRGSEKTGTPRSGEIFCLVTFLMSIWFVADETAEEQLEVRRNKLVTSHVSTQVSS